MIVMAADSNRHRLNHLVDCLQEVFSSATIVSFAKPQDALQYSLVNHVDIVFSYVVVGGMDVMRISEFIRKNNANLKLYIVAEQEVLDEAMCYEDFSGFFAHPVSADMLRQIAV